jgi:hypothetical protein
MLNALLPQAYLLKRKQKAYKRGGSLAAPAFGSAQLVFAIHAIRDRSELSH